MEKRQGIRKKNFVFKKRFDFGDLPSVCKYK